MKKTLIGIGIFLIARTIYNKIRLAQNLTFQVKSIDVSGSVFNPQLNVTVTLINPTSGQVTFNNLFGSITIVPSNLLISNVSYQGDQLIPANSSVDVLVQLNSTAFGIINTIKSLKDQKKLTIKFVGTVQADGISFPIETTTNLL